MISLYSITRFVVNQLYDIMTSTSKGVYCPKLVKCAQADLVNLCIMWAINLNYSFVPRVDLPTADQKNMQPFDDNALIFENGESYAGNSVYDRAAFSWKFLQCSESVPILYFWSTRCCILQPVQKSRFFNSFRRIWLAGWNIGLTTMCQCILFVFSHFWRITNKLQ